MSTDKGTGSSPTGQAHLLEIDAHLINISESSPNHVSISFDELSENLKHEVVNQELTKVNYKTVIASLKQQHPQILKAKLQKNPDELYVLAITVNYEFLPEVKEQIIFDKRQIKPEEAQETHIRNMKNYLRNMREQVSLLTNVQVMEGKIESVGNVHQVFTKIPHQKTLITWTLNIEKPSTTMLKGQLYLYNSVTKNRQSSKIVPDEGIYLHHDGQQCISELRFVVEQSDKYDNAILVLDGNYKGNYIVALEKVIEA